MDSWRYPNNLDEGGSPNGPPFAWLEAEAHQTRGVQVREWNQRLSEGLSMPFRPQIFHSPRVPMTSRGRGKELLRRCPAKNFSGDRIHPTKIPQTRSNHVSRFLQVTSGKCRKVPDKALLQTTVEDHVKPRGRTTTGS